MTCIHGNCHYEKTFKQAGHFIRCVIVTKYGIIRDFVSLGATSGGGGHAL